VPWGECKQIDLARGYILSHIAWPDVETAGGEFVVQFGVDEVNLPEIGLRGIARDARKMLHRRPAMRIVLDALPRKQANAGDRGFTEFVDGASRDRRYQSAHRRPLRRMPLLPWNSGRPGACTRWRDYIIRPNSP